MAEILTTNQLAEFEASVMRALRGESAGPSLAFVRLVYSSHEALRAALDTARADKDESGNLWEASLKAAEELSAKREADFAAMTAGLDLASTNYQSALSRVAELEATGPATCKGDCHVTRALRSERDEVMKQHCVERGALRSINPRAVCAWLWPSDADRLFPKEGE